MKEKGISAELSGKNRTQELERLHNYWKRNIYKCLGKSGSEHEKGTKMYQKDKAESIWISDDSFNM